MTQKTYLGNPRLNKHSEKLLLFWHTVFLIIIMSSHTIKGLLKLWPIFTLSKNGVYSSLTKKHDWPSDELNSSLHNGLCHLIHQKYKLSVSLLLFFFPEFKSWNVRNLNDVKLCLHAPSMKSNLVYTSCECECDTNFEISKIAMNNSEKLTCAHQLLQSIRSEKMELWHQNMYSIHRNLEPGFSST